MPVQSPERGGPPRASCARTSLSLVFSMSQRPRFIKVASFMSSMGMLPQGLVLGACAWPINLAWQAWEDAAVIARA
jgi:hypothetical protein